MSSPDLRNSGVIAPNAPATTSSSPVTRGVLLTLLAMFLLALVDSTTRHLAAAYSPWQIVWVRLLCFMVLMVLAQGAVAFSGFRPKRLALQLTRSFVLLAEIIAFILAFKFFPLTEVHAIAAICPLLTVLFAAVFLREQVPKSVVSALAVSTVGMAFIFSPHFSSIRWELIFPIGGALLWSIYQVLTKLATRDDSAQTSALFTPAVGALGLTVIMPYTWITPTPTDALILLASGAIGAAAHFLLVKAVSLCDTTLLQPFNYSIFLWAIVLSITLFGEWPSISVVIGACLVAASGALCMRSNIVKKPKDGLSNAPPNSAAG